jgi:hypothetical protein
MQSPLTGYITAVMTGQPHYPDDVIIGILLIISITPPSNATRAMYGTAPSTPPPGSAQACCVDCVMRCQTRPAEGGHQKRV